MHHRWLARPAGDNEHDACLLWKQRVKVAASRTGLLLPHLSFPYLPCGILPKILKCGVPMNASSVRVGCLFPRAVLVALLFVSVLAGCSAPLVAPEPTAEPTSIYQGLLQMSGAGSDETRPLKIPGRGTYLAYSSAFQPGQGSSTDCSMTATIYTAGPSPELVYEVAQTVVEQPRFDNFRESGPFDLDRGEYEVRVKSTCHWAILLDRWR